MLEYLWLYYHLNNLSMHKLRSVRGTKADGLKSFLHQGKKHKRRKTGCPMAYWNGSSDIKSAWTRRNAVFKAVCCTSSRVSVFCVRHLMTYYINVWRTSGHSMFCYIMYCVRISCWVAMLAFYNKVKSLFCSCRISQWGKPQWRSGAKDHYTRRAPSSTSKMLHTLYPL